MGGCLASLLKFGVFLAIVLFVIGEFFGLALGFPPHTPVFVYKKDFHSVSYRHNTGSANSFGLRLEGSVSAGAVLVEAFYQNPGSFQTNQAAGPTTRVLREEFRAGQTVQLNRELRQGPGIYSVTMTFTDATATVRLYPSAALR